MMSLDLVNCKVDLFTSCSDCPNKSGLYQCITRHRISSETNPEMSLLMNGQKVPIFTVYVSKFHNNQTITYEVLTGKSTAQVELWLEKYYPDFGPLKSAICQ